jgi:adenylate kinase family enzyme
MLERNGLAGQPCLHFDFGQCLRQAVNGERPEWLLTPGEIDFLRGVLSSGALLEDKDFPLAERILRSHLARGGADEATHVVLNGLPRHTGQAAALENTVRVHTVVVLQCSAETVLRRIAQNAGGDRGGRVDDGEADVRRKLAVFAERTAPLADHYQQQGARRLEISVSADMTAERMWRHVESRF